VIVLFTDFGATDPYVGQMHAAIRRQSSAPVIDLLHNVPNFNSRTGAYLLDALQREFDTGTVFVCVVDPGVGGDRAPVILEADGKSYVGPDNGLLNIVHRRAASAQAFRIDWRPRRLATSFHGRDLFAPVAAALAAGGFRECSPFALMETGNWADELAEIIYIDHYGNAMTGIRADAVPRGAKVRIGEQTLERADTFASARRGQPFWYRNSIDLVEIAVREDSAAAMFDLCTGQPVAVTGNEPPPGAPGGP